MEPFDKPCCGLSDKISSSFGKNPNSGGMRPSAFFVKKKELPHAGYALTILTHGSQLVSTVQVGLNYSLTFHFWSKRSHKMVTERSKSRKVNNLSRIGLNKVKGDDYKIP